MCPEGCQGVDPNRNWEYQWGSTDNNNGTDGNDDCCTENFRGPSAASEIEVQLRSLIG